MLSIIKWLNLPMNVKQELVRIFEIPQSGYVHVSDNIVLTDGHSDKDLQAVSLEKLQKYLGSSETDYYKLFDQVVESIKSPRVYMAREEVKSEIVPEKKKRGRKPKPKLI